jgi:membrane-associated phospholipid phosphatase
VERVRAFCRRHTPLLLFIGQYAVRSTCYFLLQYLPVAHHVVRSAADNYIPFVPFFVVFYASWFVYAPSLALWADLRAPEIARRQLRLIVPGVAIGILVFLIWPTAIDLRPEVTGNDFFSAALRLIYAADRPYNAFPSLHCYEAVAVHLATFRGTAFGKKKALRAASAALCALICASTVLVKQHALPDLIAGVAMAVAGYALLVLWERRRRRGGGADAG